MVGRPPKFSSVEELQKQVDAYFTDCDPHVAEITEWVEARNTKGQLKKDKNGLNYLKQVTHFVKTEQKPYEITALAVFLDTTRRTLIDYEEGIYTVVPEHPDYDPEKAEMSLGFSHTIKKAKAKCEAYAAQGLFGNAPTGSIFNLKANYKWRDMSDAVAPPPVNPVQFRNYVPTEPTDQPNDVVTPADAMGSDPHMPEPAIV